MKWTWTQTKVLNITGVVVLAFCTLFHLTFSNDTVGAIALLVWSVAQLFTEGGVRHKAISPTIIGNGLAAIGALLAAAHLVTFASADITRAAMLLSSALNLFTEGGLTDNDVPPGIAAALMLALFLPFSTGCSTIANDIPQLPTADKVVTVDQVNEALVKAQAVRDLARDAVAAAASQNLISDAVVADFDKYDHLFTDAYREARSAVKTGNLDSARQLYTQIRSVVMTLQQMAAAHAGGAN